jgi:hypothetical protein
VELLSETTPFAARDVLCTAPGRTELPSFRKAVNDRTSSDGEVWEDSLDVHYYLAQAQPFHAFHRMLYAVKEALSSPLLAPYIVPAALPVSFFTRPLRERMPDAEGIIPVSPDEVHSLCQSTCSVWASSLVFSTCHTCRSGICASTLVLWRFVMQARRPFQVHLPS